MPSEYDQVVREIGLSQGIFSAQQAEMALNKLRELESQGQPYPLSVVLERMGLVDETDRIALENAARYRIHRDADKEIARIVKDSGYADQATVDQCLSEQKNHYRATGETLRISEFLIRRGAISEAQKIAAEKLYELGSFSSQQGPMG